ncbi:MAG: LPS export ABC transporter permease LptG [Deltaproteobacteria bacterium]|nr:LPS export ABC transporter permease LptG [Deltaproteobacteria bacterium]
MKLLDRYLAGSFLRALLVVTLILLLLFSFIELLKQLDDIGTGSYHFQDAMIYVIYTLPGRLFDLLPVATMLAGIIGLGILSDHNELLAMQASGFSNPRICRPILLVGLILMLAAFAMAEYLVPPLEMQARTRRLVALSDSGILITDRDLWLRHRNQLIRIGRTNLDATSTDLDIYERDREGFLTAYIHSPQARIISHSRWRLLDVDRKSITPSGDIKSSHTPSMTIDLALDTRQLTILRMPPESLSPSRLFHYIRELRSRGQNAEHYTMVLWQKLCLPFAMGAMMIFSLALVFGPTRSTGGGKRMMIAILIGITLYFANQIIGDLGLLFNLHPALTTVLPVVLILLASLWLQFRKNT